MRRSLSSHCAVERRGAFMLENFSAASKNLISMKTFIKAFILAAAIAVSHGLFAETKTEGGYTLTLKASRPSALYAAGETAEFVLSVSKGGKPFAGAELDVLISKDNVAPFIRSKKKNAAAEERFTASLSEPGFLKCRITAKLAGVKQPVSMLAGAGFDALKISPSLPVPEDFAKYWDDQKKLLAQIPLNMEISERNNVLLGNRGVEADAKKSVDLYIVKADTFGGKLDAYMAKPKNAQKGKHPIIILPHGAGVRFSRFGGFFGAAAWAKEGFIALDFNALGLDSDAGADKLKEWQKQHRGYPFKNADSRDTNFFRTLYLRLCRAMDVAMAQPEWDGKTLVVFGTSQGGGQALAAGGLYRDKVSMVCAFVPALCDQTGFKKNRVNGWPHYIKRDAGGNYANPDEKLAQAIRYIDAMNFAAFIKAPTVFVVDLADDTCEPTSCFAAFANIKAPKTLITNPEARHTVPAQCYRNVMSKVFEHAKANAKK